MFVCCEEVDTIPSIDVEPKEEVIAAPVEKVRAAPLISPGSPDTAAALEEVRAAEFATAAAQRKARQALSADFQKGIGEIEEAVQLSEEASGKHGLSEAVAQAACLRTLKLKLQTAQETLSSASAGEATHSSLQAQNQMLSDTRKEVVAEYEKLADSSGHRFKFVKADVLRKWTGGALPKHQDLHNTLGVDCFVDKDVRFKDIVSGEAFRDHLVISHRWQQLGHPDPNGEQLQEIRTYLQANIEVRFVWLDFWCLPQGKRDNAAETHFRNALDKVYLLFLGFPILILLDFSYMGRFWTSYEFFLSTREIEHSGELVQAASNSRTKIVCMGAVDDVIREPMLKTWSSCSLEQAHAKLAKVDIVVTNQTDKEQQLKVLTRLRDLIPFMHRVLPPHLRQVQRLGVKHNGYFYSLLDGGEVDAALTNLVPDWLTLPPGWEIAPPDADVTQNVVKAHGWSSNVLHLRGKSWHTKNYGESQEFTHNQMQMHSSFYYNTYKACGEGARILMRKRAS